MRLSALALLLGAVAGLAACGGPPLPRASSGPPASPSRAAAPARDPVVIAIVVDQLAAWVFEERAPLLPADGGFARLRREGVYVREMRFAHAYNATASGHAALFTGAPPRESGITFNGILDRETHHFASVLDDPDARLVTAVGVQPEGPASSAKALRLPTVTDALEAQRAEAVTVSLSLKDRGAILPGGHHPDVALWFDAALDQVVTSTFFANEIPAWASRAASPQALEALRRAPWTPMDPEWIAEHARTADDAPGEGDYYGLGTTFPHDIAHAKSPAKAFRATPRADAWVLALARAALDAHREERPFLLTVSLSANDYVGHMFGPESWEAWDVLRSLDAQLAAFLDDLDARFGPDGYAVVLAADHGVVPLPESWASTVRCEGERDAWERPCARPLRIDPAAMRDALEEAARGVAGRGDWVRAVAEPWVFLTDAARALPEQTHAALVAAVRAAVLSMPGVVDAVVPDPAVTCGPIAPVLPIAELVCNSLGPGGDLYLVLGPGHHLDVGYVDGHGTNHGSPYRYDLAVPMLVRAPHEPNPGRVVAEPVDFRAFARTLSDLLRIRPPDHAAPGTSFAPPMLPAQGHP